MSRFISREASEVSGQGDASSSKATPRGRGDGVRSNNKRRILESDSDLSEEEESDSESERDGDVQSQSESEESNGSLDLLEDVLVTSTPPKAKVAHKRKKQLSISEKKRKAKKQKKIANDSSQVLEALQKNNDILRCLASQIKKTDARLKVVKDELKKNRSTLSSSSRKRIVSDKVRVSVFVHIGIKDC